MSYLKHRLFYNYLSSNNCSIELLEYFYNEFKDNEEVCFGIGQNSNCSIELMRKISNVYPSAVLQNLNCPLDIFEKYANDQRLWYEITNNPNCPSSILQIIYDQYDNLDFSNKNKFIHYLEYILAHPNCPTDIFYRERNNQSYGISVVMEHNPNCPFSKYNKNAKKLKLEEIDIFDLDNPNMSLDTFKKAFQKFKNEHYYVYMAFYNPKYSKYLIEEVRNMDGLMIEDKLAIANNKYSTPEVLEAISDTDNLELIVAIISNPKCPAEVLEKFIDVKNPQILGKILSHPNCSIYVFDYIIEKGIRYNKDLIYILNSKILDDKCPKKYIQYVSLNGELKKFLNDDALKKVLMVSNDDKNDSIFFGSYFEQIDYPNNNIDLNFLSKGISFVKEDISNSKTDFSKSVSNSISARITIKCDNENYINEKQKEFGSNRFAYGEYPQRKTSTVECWILNRLYNSKLLKRTGKQYRIINSLGFVSYYKEYEINGCKYVKNGSEWYRVEPIYWEYDSKEKMFICEKDLFGLDSVLMDKTKMLYKFFANDIIVAETMFSKEVRQKLIRSRKEQLINESPDEEDIERKLKKFKVHALSIEEEKENLELEVIILLEKLSKTIEKLNALNQKSKIGLPKINLDEKVFLEEINGHYEFKPRFIPYLKFIDLSGLLAVPNIKLSGIDFSETNLSYNPQLAYNKDLSYSKFSDINVAFKSLDGVNLIGTDMSRDKSCYDYDKAITNDETVLPGKGRIV